jgi:dihydrofolate reductase
MTEPVGRRRSSPHPQHFVDAEKENPLRKIVVSPFVTLDGVMQGPGEPDEIKNGGWMLPYISEESLKHTFDELHSMDAILLGRASYQMLSAAWPAMTDEGLLEGFADRMNSVRKYVVSKTLTDVAWNNTRILDGDLSQEIARLKQEGDRDIIVVGSCDLVHSLQQLDLVDEYRMMVPPVVVGNGKRLFGDGSKMKALKLIEPKIFRNGVMVLTYRPERNA